METPALETTDYDTGDYYHELYGVPNGRWHWAGCIQSISAFETCVKGEFLKYKIDTAVWADKRFVFQLLSILEY